MLRVCPACLTSVDSVTNGASGFSASTTSPQSSSLPPPAATISFCARMSLRIGSRSRWICSVAYGSTGQCDARLSCSLCHVTYIFAVTLKTVELHCWLANRLHIRLSYGWISLYCSYVVIFIHQYIGRCKVLQTQAGKHAMKRTTKFG